MDRKPDIGKDLFDVNELVRKLWEGAQALDDHQNTEGPRRALDRPAIRVRKGANFMCFTHSNGKRILMHVGYSKKKRHAKHEQEQIITAIEGNIPLLVSGKTRSFWSVTVNPSWAAIVKTILLALATTKYPDLISLLTK